MYDSVNCDILFFFFFNDTATTEIYTLSLHDALPICSAARCRCRCRPRERYVPPSGPGRSRRRSPIRCRPARRRPQRSEEHTSELQSRQYLVCRLLLEKKQQHMSPHLHSYTLGPTYHT